MVWSQVQSEHIPIAYQEVQVKKPAPSILRAYQEHTKSSKSLAAACAGHLLLLSLLKSAQHSEFCTLWNPALSLPKRTRTTTREFPWDKFAGLSALCYFSAGVVSPV